ncbi:hypothetical protein [Methylobacterium oxalidis]|uniref:hypothetical protein n=1 Tax=Methylobacterium oxalidis TaxID=944322 RepID=UPI003314F8C3
MPTVVSTMTMPPPPEEVARIVGKILMISIGLDELAVAPPVTMAPTVPMATAKVAVAANVDAMTSMMAPSPGRGCAWRQDCADGCGAER